MIPLGVSVGTSTLIGNAIGAGDAASAKRVMLFSALCTFILSLVTGYTTVLLGPIVPRVRACCCCCCCCGSVSSQVM
jgi:Na+-driven multidrug efflux pump